MRSGGTLLVQSLVNLGASKCFGVPGESYLDVLNALHDTRGKLDFVLCRNEGGAAFMAEAWGKLTGKPGICMVTRGPGATNASIGIHTAMQSSTPMLIFVGQIATDQRDREAFQELDYRAVFGTMAKWVTEIDHVDRVPEIISRAWAMALSGRPGPVVIALPEDMLFAQSAREPCIPVTISEAHPGDADIARAISLLSKAKRPLVIAGGGGWQPDGKQALQDFAEAANLPVLSAFRYHDVFANDHQNYAGDAGVGMPPHIRALIAESDCLLGINIRFGEMTTDAWSIFELPNPAKMIIHSHASANELNKIVAANVPIHAGPNAVAKALAAALRQTSEVGSPEWTANARKAYISGLEMPPQPGDLDMGAVIRHLREVLPEDAIITNGAGNFAIWPNKHLPIRSRMRLLAPQSGAMGYGLPAAIAAKIAEPERTIVCFAGDGDFQMNCQELGTAMQHDARPIILIVNNATYGTIRMHQERTYPERVSGTELVNPDFVTLAKSYGFHAETIAETDAFADAFHRALQSKTGAVLDLVIAKESLTPKMTLSAMRDAARKKAT